MKFSWSIHSKDVAAVQAVVSQFRESRMVRIRLKANFRKTQPRMTRAKVWKMMMDCLLTTQQKSSYEGAVARLNRSRPYKLAYRKVLDSRSPSDYCTKILSEFGGIRWVNVIGQEVADNLETLESGLWPDLLGRLNQLRGNTDRDSEREVADFIHDQLKGFGPKQSRNLIQHLGLSRYEIPIDSRVTKWLNQFGFPVKLNASALGDRGYYHFILDGIQALCAKAGVYPCVFDAAVFASFESPTD